MSKPFTFAASVGVVLIALLLGFLLGVHPSSPVQGGRWAAHECPVPEEQKEDNSQKVFHYHIHVGPRATMPQQEPKFNIGRLPIPSEERYVY